MALAENNKPNHEKLSKITLQQLKAVDRTGKALIHHWATANGLSNIASLEAHVKEDLTEHSWMNPNKIEISNMTTSHPVLEFWKEMVSYADVAGDEWMHDPARIKTIMEDNERRMPWSSNDSNPYIEDLQVCTGR
ncbi:hypothetical protein MKX08_006316 [Trichoderma sp. CBMAI-0020]|nr:hypothetical protein MKX08_006316 [Trichoderma sp. CBMAI-0020]